MCELYTPVFTACWSSPAPNPLIPVRLNPQPRNSRSHHTSYETKTPTTHLPWEHLFYLSSVFIHSFNIDLLNINSEELQAGSDFGDTVGEGCGCVCVARVGSKYSSKAQQSSHWEPSLEDIGSWVMRVRHVPGRLIPDKEILQQGPKVLKGVVHPQPSKALVIWAGRAMYTEPRSLDLTLWVTASQGKCLSQDWREVEVGLVPG